LALSAREVGGRHRAHASQTDLAGAAGVAESARHNGSMPILSPEAVADAVPALRTGLLPAIAQQWDTGEVLMLAWVDEEALATTIRTGLATYYSRSRGRLWTKGEESGHVQHIRSIAADCDGDTILYLVDQTGPACHTGTRTCFTDRELHRPEARG